MEFVKGRAFAYLLATPLIEFVLLRLIVSYGFGFHPGWPKTQDFDLVCPALVSLAVYLYALSKTSPLHLAWRKSGVLLNALLIVCFIGLTAFRSSLMAHNTTFFWVIWSLSALFAVSSSLFIWFSPTTLFPKTERPLLIPAGLAALSTFLSKNALAFLWKPAAVLTARIAYNLLRPLFSTLTLTGSSVVGIYGITSSHYCAVIGEGCSGLEGAFFFLAVHLLVCVWKPEIGNRSHKMLLAVSGFLILYVMNIIRIVLFYLIAYGMIGRFGNAIGVRITLGLFHNGLGWLLYSLTIGGFYWMVLKPKTATIRKSELLDA